MPRKFSFGFRKKAREPQASEAPCSARPPSPCANPDAPCSRPEKPCIESQSLSQIPEHVLKQRAGLKCPPLEAQHQACCSHSSIPSGCHCRDEDYGENTTKLGFECPSCGLSQCTSKCRIRGPTADSSINKPVLDNKYNTTPCGICSKSADSSKQKYTLVSQSIPDLNEEAAINKALTHSPISKNEPWSQQLSPASLFITPCKACSGEQNEPCPETCPVIQRKAPCGVCTVTTNQCCQTLNESKDACSDTCPSFLYTTQPKNTINISTQAPNRQSSNRTLKMFVFKGGKCPETCPGMRPPPLTPQKIAAAITLNRQRETLPENRTDSKFELPERSAAASGKKYDQPLSTPDGQNEANLEKSIAPSDNVTPFEINSLITSTPNTTLTTDGTAPGSIPNNQTPLSLAAPSDQDESQMAPAPETVNQAIRQTGHNVSFSGESSKTPDNQLGPNIDAPGSPSTNQTPQNARLASESKGQPSQYGPKITDPGTQSSYRIAQHAPLFPSEYFNGQHFQMGQNSETAGSQPNYQIAQFPSESPKGRTSQLDPTFSEPSAQSNLFQNAPFLTKPLKGQINSQTRPHVSTSGPTIAQMSRSVPATSHLTEVPIYGQPNTMGQNNVCPCPQPNYQAAQSTSFPLQYFQGQNNQMISNIVESSFQSNSQMPQSALPQGSFPQSFQGQNIRMSPNIAEPGPQFISQMARSASCPSQSSRDQNNQIDPSYSTPSSQPVWPNQTDPNIRGSSFQFNRQTPQSTPIASESRKTYTQIGPPGEQPNHQMAQRAPLSPSEYVNGQSRQMTTNNVIAGSQPNYQMPQATPFSSNPLPGQMHGQMYPNATAPEIAPRNVQKPQTVPATSDSSKTSVSRLNKQIDPKFSTPSSQPNYLESQSASVPSGFVKGKPEQTGPVLSKFTSKKPQKNTQLPSETSKHGQGQKNQTPQKKSSSSCDCTEPSVQHNQTQETSKTSGQTDPGSQNNQILPPEHSRLDSECDESCGKGSQLRSNLSGPDLLIAKASSQISQSFGQALPSGFKDEISPANPGEDICMCRYPPAFSLIACSGQITGNCNCNKNK